MKKLLKSLVIAMIVIMFSLAVSLATEGTATLIASKTKVKAGDTFTVTLKVRCEEGLSGAETNIVYDAGKLDLTKKEAGNSNTSGIDQELETGKFNLALVENGDTNELAYILTFKVKDTVNAGDTITISTETITGADKDINPIEDIEGKSVTITIEEDSQGNDGEEDNTQGGETGNEEEGKITEDKTNNGATSDKENVTVTNKNATQSEKEIPYTGTNIFSLVAVVFVGIITLVSYVSYKRYKNI